ncbi:HalOD1 output domain-containing protein [Halomarina oriensis]|uniref:Halobacterial output domain-containing protein n=1 Tax=Halomarina oriensis TaxID=671145 RepID=A0A6B0GQ36_9EURY|nr:hypothetical protein [Halomarina oriensis]
MEDSVSYRERAGSDVHLGTAIVEAVAETDDCAIEEVDELLGEAIDVDALERLYRRPVAEEAPYGYLRFTYCGYEVEVHTDRTIVLRATDRS